MNRSPEASQLFRVGVAAAFAALAFVGTFAIRIPIPATGGYFNLGDTFVMLAALLYGPAAGALAGCLGPTLADAIGFPQFIPATAVVKALEGLAVGWLGGPGPRRQPAVALAAGVTILVGGYFLFEAWIYPLLGRAIPFFQVTDFNAALAEIGPNLLQGVLSAAMAYGIDRIFNRAQPQGAG
jgi:uncharacterized membrane protein